MMSLPSELVVDLSRIQFAFTALFHFFFVPLTLGMTWVLVMIEACYLKTGKQVYKDMAKFWGKLFAINFAMGVVTGITMEFEFGLNWGYFSRMIGDTFGSALAIEGITAFMLEATMFGLFFFTWDKVGKKTHWAFTILLAIGANLSIVNIIVANSWMQHPVATYLNPHTMVMHLTSFVQLYTQQLAQIRVGHIMFAGALVAGMFVLGISSYYLLKNRDKPFALRSHALAAGFGLCACLFVAYLGDANGIAVAKTEPAKMAAMEGQWTTQTAPAAWYPIAFPSQSKEKNDAVWFKIPYALSLIATHSLSGTVEGLKPIIQANKAKIRNGVKAYTALQAIRAGHATPQDITTFDKYRNQLGYGLLLLQYTTTPAQATPAQFNKAAQDTIPEVWVVYWTFRVMLACWVLLILIFLASFIFSLKRTIENKRWLLWASLVAIPLPWVAAETGWFLAEMGRQPWVLKGIIPTFYGTSSLNAGSLITSLTCFILFYVILFGVEMYLMFKYARLGPSALGEKRYHHETLSSSKKGARS